jgi:alanine racemase
MKRLIKSLVRRMRTQKEYVEPLITISISKGALLGNLEQFRKMTPHDSIAPVLKSNAYGHGIALVAKTLEKNIANTAGAGNIPFFVIDSYFEAAALRNEGVRTPLLIIGYTSPEIILKNKLAEVICTVTSLDTLKKLSSSGTRVRIQLKIDTGMHRQGILVSEVEEAIACIKNAGTLILEGISSHLPDADGADASFTRGQIQKWNGIVKIFRAEFPFKRH